MCALLPANFLCVRVFVSDQFHSNVTVLLPLAGQAMKEHSLRNKTHLPELKDYQLRHRSSSYETFFEKFVRKAVGTSRFDKWASRMLLSNIATVGDEAFCLLVYENQDERWNELAKPENKGKGKKLQMNAKYTSGGGGKNLPNHGPNRKFMGWSRDGMNRFSQLCKEIEHDRMHSRERKDFEMAFRLKKREEEKTKKQRASKKKVYPGDEEPMPEVYNEMNKEILIGTSIDSQFLIDDDDEDEQAHPLDTGNSAVAAGSAGQDSADASVHDEDQGQESIFQV